MKIIYSPMTKDDIDGVYNVSKLSFSHYWSRNSIKEDFENPFTTYIVAKDSISNEIIGFIGVWIIAGEGDITNIAVHPNYRKCKVGTSLLTKLFDLCYILNCNTITLEVRASNIAAQNLYKNFNFKEIFVRKNYYQDNKEDAIIMQNNNNIKL